MWTEARPFQVQTTTTPRWRAERGIGRDARAMLDLTGTRDANHEGFEVGERARRPRRAGEGACGDSTPDHPGHFSNQVV
jgi:hypothetical protein